MDTAAQIQKVIIYVLSCVQVNNTRLFIQISNNVSPFFFEVTLMKNIHICKHKICLIYIQYILNIYLFISESFLRHLFVYYLFNFYFSQFSCKHQIYLYLV